MDATPTPTEVRTVLTPRLTLPFRGSASADLLIPDPDHEEGARALKENAEPSRTGESEAH
jgi:hypothetical protein